MKRSRQTCIFMLVVSLSSLDVAYSLGQNTAVVRNLTAAGDPLISPANKVYPVTYGFSEWGAWAACSCSSHTRTRTRQCKNFSACDGSWKESRSCRARGCHVNGNWGTWSAYVCLSKCGSGVQMRSRRCDNPPPAFSGRPCYGATTEMAMCSGLPSCKAINGGFGAWSTWFPCSKSCGGGVSTRSRGCDSPAPSNGGSGCVGDKAETKQCNTAVCPVDPDWTTWGTWDPCSITCGTGRSARSRQCVAKDAVNKGRLCPGLSRDVKACNMRSCPVDPDWKTWSPWSPCSLSCGGGRSRRLRSCVFVDPANRRKSCPGLPEEDKACNTKICPVDPDWGSWSGWSSCSVKCGSGVVSRSKTCVATNPVNNGKSCQGNVPTEQKVCSGGAPCPIDGGHSPWATWAACTASCGTSAVRRRARRCDSPRPAHGGRPCVGPIVEREGCTGLPSCKVDGGHSVWAPWAACSATCGTSAVRRRARRCDNPVPSHGGRPCVGPTEQTEGCTGLPSCKVDGGHSQWAPWTACSAKCGTSAVRKRARQCDSPRPAYGGRQCVGPTEQREGCTGLPNCIAKIHGAWSTWSPWVPTATCGAHIHSNRHRTCTAPAPSNGGNACPGNVVTQESAAANKGPCPVAGQWGDWSTWWSSCSASCGPGTHRKTRTCDSPAPAHGGPTCVGDAVITRACNAEVDCKDLVWGPWGQWACTVTCGKGISLRSRVCPKPGLCVGAGQELAACTKGACPDTIWSQWGLWACSVTCGQGTSLRSRVCPKLGACAGADKQVVTCSKGACPDTIWSQWSQWACTVTCGQGKSLRSRVCPKPGMCAGVGKEAVTCSKGACPVNGGYGQWSQWVACDVTCGTGSNTRYRACDSPRPQHGGSTCKGKYTDVKVCNKSPCPLDPAWTTWHSWTDCSVTCAKGLHTRKRQCIATNPANIKKTCHGTNRIEKEQCNTGVDCPVQGHWSSWNSWSTCNRNSCRKKRTRMCKGGNYCRGTESESEKCSSCNVDGNWGSWGTWSGCSKNCDGTSFRHRKCDKPTPSYYGRRCLGYANQWTYCNRCPDAGNTING